METGVLERVRGLEADIEKSIESVVQQDLFSQDVTNERHRILLDHFKLQQLKIIRGLAEKLLDIYLDEDEIVEAQGAPNEGEEAITSAVKKFEGKVADIREYHLTYRNLPTIKNQLAIPDPKVLETLFSVNERYGSCLDLETHYNRYSTFMIGTAAMATTTSEGNEEHLALRKRIAAWASTWPSRLEYFRFVPELPEIMVSAVDATRKLTGFAAYKDFVTSLLSYLNDFYSRAHPLSTEEIPRLLAEAENGCEEFWSALSKEGDEVKVISDTYGNGNDSDNEEDGDGEGSLRKRGPRLPHGTKSSCGLAIPPPLKKYIKSYSMWPLPLVKELVEHRQMIQLSVERMTCEENPPAEDSSRTAALSQLAEQLPESLAEVKAVCVAEAKISSMLRSLLFDVLQHTEKSILRDYSKTAEELEIDRARADGEFAESLDMVSKNSTNSLEGTAMSYAVARQSLYAQGGSAALLSRGAPPAVAVAGGSGVDKKTGAVVGDLADSLVNEKFVGEDGTALPRWLIQLQQLEKSFVCEVCGGTVYQGPKVFREHFGQERHAEGLRRLGVSQNLREFEGIASIRSAIEMRDQLGDVHGSLRKRLRDEKELEEIQDGQGHVLTNKQYLSLQQRGRQA